MRLSSRTQTIHKYNWLAKVKFVIPLENINLIHANLIYISNNLKQKDTDNEHGNKNFEISKEIQLVLKI